MVGSARPRSFSGSARHSATSIATAWTRWEPRRRSTAAARAGASSITGGSAASAATSKTPRGPTVSTASRASGSAPVSRTGVPRRSSETARCTARRRAASTGASGGGRSRPTGEELVILASRIAPGRRAVWHVWLFCHGGVGLPAGARRLGGWGWARSLYVPARPSTKGALLRSTTLAGVWEPGLPLVLAPLLARAAPPPVAGGAGVATDGRYRGGVG